MTADFVNDLVEFPVCEVDQALQEYRRDPKSKFFPTPGAIRAIILDGRRERAAIERMGEPIKNLDSRPIRWWSHPPYLWKSHWRESDIPHDERTGYFARLKAKRAAGAQGWAACDFAGLARKQGQ